MAGKNIAVLGIFPSDAHAETAAMRLMESGFTSEDISVLLHEHSVSPRRPSDSGPVRVKSGALGTLSELGWLAIPEAGNFIAAGPVRAILSSIGNSGLAGAFVGMGIPGNDAKRLEDEIRSGGVMLSVRCSSSVSVTRAENLLKQAGAGDIASDHEITAASSDKKSEARM